VDLNFNQEFLNQFPKNKNGIPILDRPRTRKPELCSQHQDGPDGGPICDRCKEANETTKRMLGNKEFY
jgi:hypothetical protein